MKKVSALFLAACLAASAACVFFGCAKEKKETRPMDTRIVDVYQYVDGSVIVELENFLHEDLQDDAYGREASSMEFSPDGGKTWQTWSMQGDEYEKTGKGVYFVMMPDYNADYTAVTGFSFAGYDGTTLRFGAGDRISITVRIPESDKYAASQSVTSESILLKTGIPAQGEIFSTANSSGKYLQERGYLDSFLPFSSNGSKAGTYLPYADGEYVRFGMIAETDKDQILSVLWADEMSEEQKSGVSALEYRVISPDGYADYMAGKDSAWADMAELFKNNAAQWTSVPAAGIDLSVAANKDFVWIYTLKTADVTQWDPEKEEMVEEAEYTTFHSLVILLRVKETDTSVASFAEGLEIVLQQEVEYRPA